MKLYAFKKSLTLIEEGSIFFHFKLPRIEQIDSEKLLRKVTLCIWYSIYIFKST